MELMEKVEELKQKKAAAQTAAMIKSIKSEASGDPTNAAGAAESAGTTTEPGKPAADVLSGNPLASTNVNQKLRVCDVCGAFLSIFDSDRRLADHFGGKLHLGYLQIRKKIEEIAEMRRERRRALNGSDNKDPATSQESATDRAKKESSERRRRRSRTPSRSRSRPRYASITDGNCTVC